MKDTETEEIHKTTKQIWFSEVAEEILDDTCESSAISLLDQVINDALDEIGSYKTDIVSEAKDNQLPLSQMSHRDPYTKPKRSSEADQIRSPPNCEGSQEESW